MIRIQLLGVSIVFFLNFCNGQQFNSFSTIRKGSIANYSPEFKAFCLRDTLSYELAAVASSFFGEYRQAIYFATKEAIRRGKIRQKSIGDASDSINLIARLKEAIQDPQSSQKDVIFLKNLLSISTQSSKYDEIFATTRSFAAPEFIVRNAKKYHFLLINEAHYSSRNRAFTQSLLKPLWDQGFRYLALEALLEDSIINKQGFPTTTSGYYLRDATFGNLVREAQKIGYKLISYESRPTVHGADRENEQAINIYAKTWQQDRLGKVLVHAGYSHISEFATDDYQPMGARLSELIGNDVLSVEQERMQNLLDKGYNHSYYNFVNDSIGFNESIVLTDSTGITGFVDPINSIGVDFQVYNPPVKFIKDRPEWLYTPFNRVIDIPSSFNKYSGCLIQAIPFGEPKNAVPVDQMILKPNRALLLPTGTYDIYIIDRNGSLVGTSSIIVN